MGKCQRSNAGKESGRCSIGPARRRGVGGSTTIGIGTGIGRTGSAPFYLERSPFASGSSLSSLPSSPEPLPPKVDVAQARRPASKRRPKGQKRQEPVQAQTAAADVRAISEVVPRSLVPVSPVEDTWWKEPFTGTRGDTEIKPFGSKKAASTPSALVQEKRQTILFPPLEDEVVHVSPVAGIPKQEAPEKGPPVWAESRQELCEALPYYRAFQSGLYMYGRVAFGYLLDSFPAPRDIWAEDGRVIISHGGGQCVKPTDPLGASGPALAADQSSKDARVDALIRAHEKRTPIILLVGEGYANLPWKLGTAYAVLGWYWITLVWVEAEPVAKGITPPEGRDYFHRYKIRFDWVQSQGVPWWIGTPTLEGLEVSESAVMPELEKPSENSDLDSDFSSSTESEESDEMRDTRVPRRIPGTRILKAPPLASGRCVIRSSPPSVLRICKSCKKAYPQIYAQGWFCVNPDCRAFWRTRRKPAPRVLSYSPAWLSVSETPGDVRPPYDVRPPMPREVEVDGSAGDRTLWKGWVCHGCGRANCRHRWEVWECRGCGLTTGHLGDTAIPSSHVAGWYKPYLGDPIVDPSSRIKSSIRSLQGGILMSYTLPKCLGTIFHLIRGDKSVADGIWEGYQTSAASTLVPLFERRALFQTSRVRGQLLAQHFAINSGAKYKYSVDSASFSFADSPQCVCDAREEIASSVEAALGHGVPFNEVLSVLYREGQKMSWHDDGEEGLGSVVASLSLGSTATMSWRGKSNGRIPAFARGREGCVGERKGKGKGVTALSLTLGHGDIVIMAGDGIQTAYSHRVIPHGFRVAATARVIG